MVFVMVLPDLLIRKPNRAGNTEPVLEFHLPLKGERRRAQDEHGTVVQQRGKHGAGGE
jgi:hypothetical protein